MPLFTGFLKNRCKNWERDKSGQRPVYLETFEKWLRRVSKIFSAKKTTKCNHDP
jgi:hypothetical protein